MLILIDFLIGIMLAIAAGIAIYLLAVALVFVTSLVCDFNGDRRKKKR